MKQSSMKKSMGLQVHNFEDRDGVFTFIPYGLEPNLSKEAVKVHVLHGRKRNEKPQKSLALRRKNAPPYQILQWDSNAKTNDQKLVSESCSNRSTNGNDYRVCQRVAYATQSSKSSYSMHWPDPVLSLDHFVLHNPFAERLKDDYGVSNIESANFLVDHYVSRCGTSRFPRELLARYWQDSATFKAFLAHAATLFTLETGLPPPIDVEVLMYSALREIRRRVSDPIESYADGTALAVAMLANVEEGRSHHDVAAWHWRGLRQLLRLRGTFTSLRMHRDLHTMLLWREIMTSNSQDFCFGHGIHDYPELQFCNDHIVGFFDNFTSCLEDGNQLAEENEDVQFLGAVVNRDLTLQCEWTGSMRRRSEIACLTYLCVLAISAPVSAESRRILSRIKKEVVLRESYGMVTQEELLFIMLSQANIDHEWKCQQIWQLSRCVFMTRTLAVRDWKTIRDVLSLFLGIEDGCDSRSEVLEDWQVLSKKLLLEDGCNVKYSNCHATVREGVPSESAI